MSGVHRRIGVVAIVTLLATGGNPILANASAPYQPVGSAVAATTSRPQVAARTARISKNRSGALRIKVRGLPSKGKADVRIRGPQRYKKKVVKSLTLNLKPGKYKVRNRSVTVHGARFAPKSKKSVLTIKREKTVRLVVKYIRDSSPGPTPTPEPSPRPTFDTTIRWLPAERGRVACQSAPAPGINELRLELCDKEGISLFDPSQVQVADATAAATEATSNLKTIEGDGTLSEAVVSGKATARSVQVGPTGKTYLTLASPINLIDNTSSSDQCAFLEVNEATGVPACVDNTMRDISRITFDNAGNVYYAGTATGSPNTVLREWDGVSVRNLITSEARVSNFAVTPDGYVVLSGSTGASGSGWTRMVAGNGSLSNVFAGSEARFISLYPDGNVYMGMWGMEQFGIRRLLAATKAVDPIYWTGAALNGNPAPPAYFPVNDFCTPRVEAFCGSFGAWTTKSVITQSGKVLVLAGAPGSAVLMQYWPSVKFLNTAVTRAAKMQSAGQLLFLAGTNANGDNIATLYDPTTDTEQVVIPSSNQIEIYNASYSAEARKVLFDGLRFADNQRVIGEIAVPTGNLTVRGTSAGLLSDLQAF